MMLRTSLALVLVGCASLRGTHTEMVKEDYPRDDQGCIVAILIQPDGTDEQAEDLKNLLQAMKRCPEIYGSEYCLKQFRKKGPQNYHAICGRRE